MCHVLCGNIGTVKGERVMKQMEEHVSYYTVKELVAKLYMSDASIKRYCKKGKFPGAIKYKGYWLIPKEAVQ